VPWRFSAAADSARKVPPSSTAENLAQFRRFRTLPVAAKKKPPTGAALVFTSLRAPGDLLTPSPPAKKATANLRAAQVRRSARAHVQAGKQTLVTSVFPDLGGTLISNRRIWPSVTACKYSHMASTTPLGW